MYTHFLTMSIIYGIDSNLIFPSYIDATLCGWMKELLYCSLSAFCIRLVTFAEYLLCSQKMTEMVKLYF